MEIALEAFGFDPDASMSHAELEALLRRQQQEFDRLNAEGLPATAIVVESTDLGHRVNQVGAICRLRLEVIGSDGRPYDAELMAPIHHERLGLYAVGAETPIRFDPRSPTTVAIDASRAFTSNPGEDPLG